MSRFVLQSLLCFLLLLAISVFGSRVLKSAGSVEVDFVGLSPASLTSQTRALLERLDGSMTFTLFASPRERMPSHLKEVEGRSAPCWRRFAPKPRTASTPGSSIPS